MPQNELDRIDRLILRALTRNSDISRQELCIETGLSAPGLSKRLQWLRESGLIARYTIDVNYVRAGLATSAIVLVRIAEHTKAFEREIVRIPNVVKADKLLGEYDYCLNIVCETNDRLVQVLQDIVTIDGVKNTEVLVTFGSIKDDSSDLFA